jgi:hypothetical protein
VTYVVGGTEYIYKLDLAGCARIYIICTGLGHCTRKERGAIKMWMK